MTPGYEVDGNYYYPTIDFGALPLGLCRQQGRRWDITVVSTDEAEVAATAYAQACIDSFRARLQTEMEIMGFTCNATPL